MSNLQLFKGNALANSDLFKSLQNVNSNLIGGSFGTSRRISLRGGKFREVLNGEQIKVSKDDTMNIVIIDAAPVARTYYAGEYDSEKVAPPTCWSADTKVPSDDVPEENRQASRCGDCPMNVKGSGAGNSRACRYSQRLAVAIEGNLDTVYQLQLPATSLFGESKEGQMPMQGYARFLQAHNTPAIAIVTEMRFDEEADVPKLYFKAIRPLEEDELQAAVDLKETEECRQAITFTVSQQDKVAQLSGPTEEEEEAPAPAKKPAAKKAAKPKPKPEPVEEDDDEEEVEPVKASAKKPTPKPKEEALDLSDIVDAWDD